MDFDDLLMHTVDLLETVPDVREKWQERFRHVMVDEYQDTNHAQYRLVRVLGASHGNVCVVGDSDQSIYSWRGADIRNILDFSKDFPNAEVIRLEQNYRSTQRILDAANGVIAHNTGRQEKRLWSELGSGELGAAGGVRGRAERGAARRVADRRPPERGLRGVRRRGLLPHERAVARDRGPAPRATTSPTRWSAACGSTTAPRSRTRSPTCRC